MKIFTNFQKSIKIEDIKTKYLNIIVNMRILKVQIKNWRPTKVKKIRYHKDFMILNYISRGLVDKQLKG